MKKMIIFLPKMSVGGMERSLANLLNISNYSQNYNITLFVGYIENDEMFKNIPKNIDIKIMHKSKLNIIGKIIMGIKLLINNILIKNKYDISICYSHHHSILSKMARKAAKNNIIFVHNDLKLARTQKQIDKMNFDKFSKVVCVSKAAKSTFVELFPDYNKKNIYVINNYIDGDKIIELAKENFNRPEGTLFINVARHLESAKKITRIINSAEKLKKEGYNFKVILAGDGPDSELYREMAKNKDYIIMLGNVSNPFKYIAKSDAFILSSSFEGYGMVLDEARTLNIPIISTDVADAKSILDEGYGIICENSEEGVYKGMKNFLENGYRIEKVFDYKLFNKNITEKLDEIVMF